MSGCEVDVGGPHLNIIKFEASLFVCLLVCLFVCLFACLLFVFPVKKKVIFHLSSASVYYCEHKQKWCGMGMRL